MSFDWSEGALAEGLQCYQNGEFFLAHEHWESVWLGRAEPEKTFLQALIQIAAAFHHQRRGNAVGAASLLRGALRKLSTYPATFGGIEVESLRASLRTWLEALATGESLPQLPMPFIC
jgi:uncharacterized protein